MKTVAEFFQRVENWRRRLGISRMPAWFRGHSNESYKLVPTVLRRSNGTKHERNLYTSFVTQGAAWIPQGSGSWEVLAIMQHHGAPTRLLDWTESLHTALFFALLGKPKSPCIWVLNPFQLNQKSTGKNVVYDQADSIGLDYYNDACLTNWKYELPVALDAPWRNKRVAAQKGSFTFHGTDFSALEDTCPKCVGRVAIPPHLVKPLRKELSRSGIDHFRLFPDPDGLAKALRAQFKF